MTNRISIDFSEQLVKDYVTINSTPTTDHNTLYLQSQKQIIERQLLIVIQAVASDVLDTPKYDDVWCSNCGQGFGPGNNGFSHCESHAGMTAID